MAVKFTDIKRAKADADAKKEDAAYRVKATLAEYDTPGSAKVANRAGFVWCQRDDQAGNLAQVYNKVAPPLPGLPVTLIKRPYSDTLEVESYDAGLLQNTPVGGRTFLEQHARQHEPGGLDPMYVYLRMLTPFRTSPNNPADLSVVIAPLQYCDKTGTLKTITFPEPVDLSSYVPTTGRRYVGLYYVDGVGLNVIDGDVYSTNPIRPTVGGYPTACVLLKAGQTAIVEADIQDARLILNSVGDETYSADELAARLVAKKTMRGGGVITFAADASSLTTTAPIYWDLPNEITLSVPAQEMTLIYENSAIVANFSRAEWLITGQPVTGVIISDLANFAYNLNNLLIATIIPAGDGVVARFANGLELLPGMSYDTATGVITAGIIHYDNATSGLTGATVQAAIDEVISGFSARVRAVVLTGLSTATNAAIAATDSVLSAFGKLQKQITDHLANTSNPHGVTKEQVGLGNVSNVAQVTSVTGTSPVVSSGGTTPAISMPAATASVNGYMTTAYASKLNGIEAGATADQTAAEVPFTATGSIAATNVQAAIAELGTEKVAKAGDTMTGGLYGMIPSTASTMVGNEYNLLHNAHTRAGITITQTGTGLVPSTNSFFDGLLGPAYSSDGIDPANPFVLTISGLPTTHTQTGGVIGWTSRYWYPIRYKLEVYDIYQTSRWKTIVDTSGAGVATKELLIPIYPTHSGQFTSIRLTVYQGGGSNGANGFPRWGISELFFIHPEAMSLHQYLNADTVDCYHASPTPTASTIPVADSGGKINTGWIPSATTSAAGSMSPGDKAKLDGIEAGATADQTAAEILTAIKTVDGTGSGLDADTVDGVQAASLVQTSRTISTTAPLTGGGDLSANLTLAINAATTSAAGSMSATDKTKLDGIEAGATADQTAAEILTAIKTVDGAGSGLDADTVDGVEASSLVQTSRTISTTAPLTGEGNLSANLTLAINAATTSAAGSMSAADKGRLDKINELYHASYYISGDVSLTSWTPVTLTGLAALHTGNWPTTPSSGHFTIPVTGYYLIQAIVTFDVCTSGQVYGAQICQTSGGTTYEEANNRVVCSNSGQYVLVPISVTRLLYAGATVSLRAVCSTSQTNCLLINNGGLSNIEITLLRRTA